MKKSLCLVALMLVFSGWIENAGAAAGTPAPGQTPLDTHLEPTTDEKSNLLQDMGVVQKKAMRKRQRFLLSTYLSLDFSDGPYTNYSIHANPGYAFSDFFEMYVSFAPAYLVSPRSIVKRVESLQTPSGGYYTITAERPKSEYGLEFLWAPFYGKDSFGISSIIRSDTFFKLGLTQVKYETVSGMSYKLGVGKTFFFGQMAGFRFCMDYNYVQTVINSQKSFQTEALAELGLMFYF
jgi:outer membrane beta-barrel protein